MTDSVDAWLQCESEKIINLKKKPQKICYEMSEMISQLPECFLKATLT